MKPIKGKNKATTFLSLNQWKQGRDKVCLSSGQARYIYKKVKKKIV